jgi:hypothetical protein
MEMFSHESLMNEIISRACPTYRFKRESDGAKFFIFHIELCCAEYYVCVQNLNSEKLEFGDSLKYRILEWESVKYDDLGYPTCSELGSKWMAILDAHIY